MSADDGGVDEWDVLAGVVGVEYPAGVVAEFACGYFGVQWPGAGGVGLVADGGDVAGVGVAVFVEVFGSDFAGEGGGVPDGLSAGLDFGDSAVPGG